MVDAIRYGRGSEEREDRRSVEADCRMGVNERIYGDENSWRR